jgi:hypothetical protein
MHGVTVCFRDRSFGLSVSFGNLALRAPVEFVVAILRLTDGGPAWISRHAGEGRSFSPAVTRPIDCSPPLPPAQSVGRRTARAARENEERHPPIARG